MNGMPFLEILARMAGMGVVAGALVAVLSYVWRGLVRRVDALEKWRLDHEGAHTQILLKLQTLEIHSEAARAALARVEILLTDVASCVVANRRHPRACETAG